MLTIEVQDTVGIEVPVRDIQSWASTSHEQVSKRQTEAVIRIVEQDEAKALNAEFRGKDYATNVLSFTYETDDVFDLPEGIEIEVEETNYLGDIIICDAVIKREAEEQSKTYESHLAHMVVHGILHLNGYDHEILEEAKKMEQLEIDILDKLGFHNPYI